MPETIGAEERNGWPVRCCRAGRLQCDTRASLDLSPASSWYDPGCLYGHSELSRASSRQARRSRQPRACRRSKHGSATGMARDSAAVRVSSRRAAGPLTGLFTALAGVLADSWPGLPSTEALSMPAPTYTTDDLAGALSRESVTSIYGLLRLLWGSRGADAQVPRYVLPPVGIALRVGRHPCLIA